MGRGVIEKEMAVHLENILSGRSVGTKSCRDHNAIVLVPSKPCRDDKQSLNEVGMQCTVSTDPVQAEG